MKKGEVVGIFIVVLLFVSFSFVSAFSFQNTFDSFEEVWGMITGHVTSGLCTDSDGGKKYNLRGSTCIGGDCSLDDCINVKSLQEWFCVYYGSDSYKLSASYSCPVACSDGACVDEPPEQTCVNYFLDFDDDSYGTSDSRCLENPSGDYTAIQSGDCDDNNSSINPSVMETCNGIDDDCDGIADEGCENFVDTFAPNVGIVYPVDGKIYVENVKTLNFTVSDETALASCWYSFDGGLTNVTVSCGQNVTGLNFGEGNYFWIVYANDSSGNFNSISVSFVVNYSFSEGIESLAEEGHIQESETQEMEDKEIEARTILGDADSDGILDIHDPDKNGDGVLDVAYSTISADDDLDEDGTLNINDEDIDGDGILNGFDVAPFNAGKIEVGVSAEPTGVFRESDFVKEFWEDSNEVIIKSDGEPLENSEVKYVKNLAEGYIIEFEDEPLAVQQKQLEEEAYANEGNVIAQIGGVVGLATTRSNLENKVEGRKNQLERDRENTKKEIKEVLGKEGIITGNVVGDSEKNLQITNEYKTVFNGIAVNVTDEEAEEIKKVRGVKTVHSNRVVNITLAESVPKINADDVWRLNSNLEACSGDDCLTGKGITIGIIDTGVDYTHEDLGGCTTGEFTSGNCEKVVGGYDFVNNDNDPIDDHAHGTHVAATVAGNGVLKGTAPDAEIYAYKVLSSYGGGSSADIIDAIERSTDPNQDGSTGDHLDIISLSLGGSGNPDDAMSKAIDSVVEAGVVAVVAAGNSGPNEGTIGSPGTARKAITVGAVYKTDYLAYFSSRGPVIWTDEEGNENAIVKPDVVAPGVDICAAYANGVTRYDSYKCLDDNHIAIDGTSMATPHVSGAVALLLQKNPDWTPEEIKASLKGTAVDLGYGVNEQGAGRIDILESVELESSLPIAEIETGGEVSGVIDIVGTAKGENFESYALYYGIGENPDEWVEITSSTDSIENGVLYLGFDTSNLNDGVYYLMLAVISSDKNVSQDLGMVNVKNSEFIDLGNLGYFNGEIKQIKGNIFYPHYDGYRIKYETENDYNSNTNNWQTLCNIDGKATSEVLCSFDTDLDNGGYYLRIEVNNNGNWVEGASEKIVIVKEMLEGWPIKLDYIESVVIIQNNNQKEIALRAVNDGKASIDFYDKDANLVNSIKNLDGYRPIPSDVFSVYQNNLVTAYGPIDSSGDFLSDNWRSLSYGLGGFPFVISSVNGEDYFFKGPEGPYRDGAQMQGFTPQGNTLSNFPLQVQMASGQYFMGSRWPGIIKKGNSGEIAVVSANYDANGDSQDITIYLNLYSIEGDLINQVILGHEPEGLFSWYGEFTNLVAGDFTGDGNQEVVVGYRLTNVDEYDNKGWDAIKTYFKIINSDGNIISDIGPIEGYQPLGLALTENSGNLEVIARMTGYSRDRIISFGLDGQIHDFEALPLQQRLTSLTVAGTGNNQKIIVGYRPRFWGGSASGLNIFNANGTLDKVISIPTLGQVDLYSYDPILTDFNDDGELDIVQQFYFINNAGEMDDSRVYAFGLNISTPEANNWPMFQHDPQYTGCYDCESIQLPQCTPSPEICNGVDDDCDGEVDEDFENLGESCSVGVGACENSGNYVCSEDGKNAICDAVAGEPSEEVCGDNIDNDCDGKIDSEDRSSDCSCLSDGTSCWSGTGSYCCSGNCRKRFWIFGTCAPSAPKPDSPNETLGEPEFVCKDKGESCSLFNQGACCSDKCKFRLFRKNKCA